MVDSALTAGALLDDIFGAVDQDKQANDKEDDHQCPEKGHEDNAASIFKDSSQDQIAVERNPSFLDLNAVCKQRINVAKGFCVPTMSSLQLLQLQQFPS
jgi:hypothetical protein